MKKIARCIRPIALAAAATVGVGGCGGTGIPTQPKPSALAATAAAQAVSLNWTASSGPETYTYSVYRGTAAGPLSTKKKIAAGLKNTAYGDAPLTNGAAYYYQVTAVSAAGETDGSNEATATPSASLPPSAPAAMATPGNASVRVSWAAVPGATSYNIYGSTATGVTPANGTKGTASSSPYLQGGLSNGTTYYYVATAVNAAGESPPSSQVSATPAAQDAYIRALVISWSSPPPAGAQVLEASVCVDDKCVTPIADATVTVSGTTLAYNAARRLYEAPGPMPAPGDVVNLVVTVPGSSLVKAGTYSASATQYGTFPTVTSPAPGATWQASSPNTVSWTSGAPTTTTPASAFIVGIQDSTGAMAVPAVETAVASTSYTLPAQSLISGSSYTVWVGIATGGITTARQGIPIRNALAGSGLWLEGVSADVAFTVQ